MLSNIFGTNEFERIVSKEIELTARKQAASAQLAIAREAAALALVDGEAQAEIGSVSRLTAEIETATRAIQLVRDRRAAGIAGENRKQAESIRAEAATKSRELATLQAKTAKLWAQLSELEDAKLPGESIMIAPGGLRSERLAHEIEELSQKAADRESAGLAPYGFVDIEATSDTEIVEAVLRHRSAGPSAEAVQNWINACADTNRVPGRAFGNLPRRVRLDWQAGLIDVGASYVSVPGLTQFRTGVMNSIGIIDPRPSTTLYDVKSGEFRATRAA